ncbi:hypothetical protein B0T10DRAFT_525872 [Thelonectria olida]|uniref:NAD(P)-binding domain-containing protein n=1 Tax=Thelonectria olida TaxID=1576542 RepID=A0A9P9AWP8_9HYPO|nr:hypothetical protein B0T10DRAFT_525872 [Thelonectria olida]
MSGSHILVLGGTGPAGTCLIRELLYREHPTIAYVRNPSKIPHDLSSSPLLQIIKGEMSDLPKHSLAIAQSSTIVLLLGPNSLRISDPQLFADIYSKSVFPLMRERSVKRILAMGTISIYEPEDKPSLIRWFVVLVVRLLASIAYVNILNVGQAFRTDAQGLDWTVFRIAGILGGADEASWRRDRDERDTFVGWQRRGAMAKWLRRCSRGKR